ncbi:carboxypeptidase-like regulatory domain-containing protein [Oscillatoria amoena NRMC-F 0135]|nr:carboxypeptidase-like regulatory domain-containing protein [Oscillatoria amoena NRMC-F 0135]
MQGRIGIFILFLIFGSSAIAQSYSVEGTMQDSSNRQPMIGVNIILTSFRDSTLKFYGVTNLDGKFTIKDVQQGGYRMYATSIGYNPYSRTVRVGENLKLGVLLMTEATVEVSGAEVVERLPPAKVKGDTTEYNSQAFKTNPDATAEDLVKKNAGCNG